jgi:glucokinase
VSSYLGVEIGGTKLQLVVFDGEMTVQTRLRYAIEPERGAAAIRANMEEAVAEILQKQPVTAAGIGFGGPVDWQGGTIGKSYHVAGWTDFPLAAWLSERLGCPAFLENDANVAALGEAVCGAGQGQNPVFYVTMGSGVGGGLVVDDEIYHGVPPGEVEFGHVRLDKRGTTLQSACAGWAVDAQIRQAVAAEPNGTLARLTAGQTRGEARWLLPAVQQGDTTAHRIFDRLCDNTAFALSHAVHLFHPATIVIGGGLSLMGEPFRAEIGEKLPDYLMDAFRPGPAVRLSQLAEDAVPVGAAVLAMRRIESSVVSRQ